MSACSDSLRNALATCESTAPALEPCVIALLVDASRGRETRGIVDVVDREGWERTWLVAKGADWAWHP